MRRPRVTVSPADCGSVVMGTGVVSLALSLDGRETLARLLLSLAALAWLVLVPLFAGQAVRARRELEAPGSLTAVAGTAVLGTGLVRQGDDAVAAVLLGVAFLLWLVLLPPVLRRRAAPTMGAAFLVTVATESLAALAGELAVGEDARWLLDAALAPFLIGLVLYPVVAARFDRRQVLTGPGDHWVAGGALAISALAGAEIVRGADVLATLGGVAPIVQAVAVVAWVLAVLWLPVLVAGELVRPRLRYSTTRWSTVFPVGMYAASSFALGAVTQAGAMTGFAQAWVWVAAAVWLVVAAGMVRRPLARGGSA